MFALHVDRWRRVGIVRRQDQRITAAPASHELRRDQLLSLRRLAVLPQEVAERADVLLEPPVGQETAVPGQDLGLRQSGRDAALVRVTEKKLAGLEGRAGARGGHVPDSLD